MASLTDTLPTIQTAKGVSPTSLGGSGSSTTIGDTIKGASSLFESVIGSFDRSADRAWAEEQRAHTRDAWANEAEGKSTANEVAVGLRAIDKGLEQPPSLFSSMPGQQPEGNPTSSNWAPPFDVVDAANDINMAKRAVVQGKVPQEAVQLKIDSLWDDLQNKHPEQAANLATYFATQGITHPGMRAVINASAADQSVFDDKQSQLKLYRDAAAKSGAPPGLSDADTVDYGRKAIQVQLQQKMAKEAAEEARNATKFGWEADDRSVKQASKLSTDAALLHADLLIGGYQTKMGQLLAGGGPDTAKQLSEFTPQIKTAFDQLEVNTVAQMHANHATTDDVKTYQDQLHAKRDAMLGYFDPSNTASYMAVQGRALKTMQDSFQIDAGKALPMFMALKSAAGAGFIENLFAGDPTMGLDAKSIQAVKGEMSAWHPGTNDGTIHITNALSILKGQLKIDQIHPDMQQKTFRTMNAGVVAAAQELTKGNKDPTIANSWRNGYTEVLNAATTVKPGASLEAIQAATQAVTGPTARGALEATKSDQLHGPVVQASRATAANLMIAAQGTGPNATQYQHLFFNDKTGIVDIAFDGTRWDKDHPTLKNIGGVRLNNVAAAVSGQGGPPGANVPNIRAAAAIGDATLVKKRDILNANIGHLVGTMGEDPNLIRGLTPKQYGKALFEGRPTEAPANHMDAKKALQDETNKFTADISHLSGEIATGAGNLQETGRSVKSSANASLYQPVVKDAAQQYNVSPTLINNVIRQESHWDPNADAHINFPNSHAYGLGQTQPDTAKGLGFHPDDRKDPVKSIHMTAKYIGQLLAKHKGDVRAALRDYSGGSYTEADYNTILNGV